MTRFESGEILYVLLFFLQIHQYLNVSCLSYFRQLYFNFWSSFLLLKLGCIAESNSEVGKSVPIYIESVDIPVCVEHRYSCVRLGRMNYGKTEMSAV